MMIRALLLLSLFPSLAFADGVDVSQYFDTHSKEIQDTIGYENKPVKGQDLPLEQAEGLGSTNRQQVYDDDKEYKCTKEHCEVGHTFSTAATLNRATKMEEAGFIRDEDGNFNDNKGYLDKAKQTIKKTKIDFLSGSYTDCKPDQESITNKTLETCEEYYDVKHNTCFPSQVVEIDPKYTYLCSKKREVRDKVCIEVLKGMKCKQSTECAAGGVVPGSVESGMEWHYDKSSSTMRLGSLGTYYWNCGNNCQKVVRAAKFEISHKELIKTFRLKKLFLNNLLQVSLNGVTVYNSLGGDKLEIKGGGAEAWVDAGQGKGGNCLINAGRKIPDYVSIDLIPHLKEGQNEIVMELAYSYYGHIHIEIEAKQLCCTDWQKEEKEEKCDYL